MNISQRSDQKEIMDDFELQGPALEEIFQDLHKVNSWLGGNSISLDGVRKLLESTCFDQPVSIMDIGCGDGSLLKEVATYGREQGITMKLLGVDANKHAIEIAKQKTKDFPEIQYEAVDVFSEEFQERKVDIILCILTLHHFKDEQIVNLLQSFIKMAQLGVVINDLERSKTAYHLFQLFSAVFMKNEIAKKDGLTSIVRSFKRKDLIRYGKLLEIRKQDLNWKWAFRFQWVLFK